MLPLGLIGNLTNSVLKSTWGSSGESVFSAGFCKLWGTWERHTISVFRKWLQRNGEIFQDCTFSSCCCCFGRSRCLCLGLVHILEACAEARSISDFSFVSMYTLESIMRSRWETQMEFSDIGLFGSELADGKLLPFSLPPT